MVKSCDEEVKRLNKLIESVADLNLGTGTNYISLHYSVQLGFKHVVFAFIKYGADLNERDKHGNTAITIAARKSHWDLVDSLIDAGAKFDRNQDKTYVSDEEKNTELHLGRVAEIEKRIKAQETRIKETSSALKDVKALRFMPADIFDIVAQFGFRS